MFELLGYHAEGQCLDTRHRFIAIRAVAHDTRETRHFRQPPAVILAFKLDRKSHAGTVTSEPSAQQPLEAVRSQIDIDAAIGTPTFAGRSGATPSFAQRGRWI